MITLRSNEFNSDIAEGFQRLREANNLFDVTLVCDGGEVQAHKALLAAISPHFQQVFNQNSDQNPRLDLPDVKINYVQMMIEFIYNGEVDIAQHEFSSFIAATDVFQVKGIYTDPEENQNVFPIKSEPRGQSEELIPIKAEPRDYSGKNINSGSSSNSLSVVTPAATIGLPGSVATITPTSKRSNPVSAGNSDKPPRSPVPGRGAVGADTAAGRMASSMATPAPAGRVNVSMSPARFGNFVSLLSGSGANVSIGLAPAVEVASTRAARSNAAAAGASSGAARSTAAASGSCAAAAVSTTAAAAAAATTAAAAAATTTTGAAAAAAMEDMTEVEANENDLNNKNDSFLRMTKKCEVNVKRLDRKRMIRKCGVNIESLGMNYFEGLSRDTDYKAAQKGGLQQHMKSVHEGTSTKY